MKDAKAQAKSMHAKRVASLGGKSTSKHPGYAAGGAVHGDEREDRALVKGMVKPSALKRADGGRVKKAKGDTNVTIVVTQPPAGGSDGPAAGAGPMMPPSPALAAAVAPRSPVAAPMTPPPGLGGVAGLGGSGMGRADGGRVKAGAGSGIGRLQHNRKR